MTKQEVADVGFTPEMRGYEALTQDPTWDWTTRTRPRDDSSWKLIVPKTAPPVGKELPQIIQHMVDSTWKFAEPAAGAARSSTLVIGARNASRRELMLQRNTYSAQVRPTEQVIDVKSPSDAAIAADWKVFEQIERTNAITFRGDTRSPWDVLFKCDGFHPPNSRTDRDYLERNIFPAFADYLQRRYGRALTLQRFVTALNSSAAMPREQRILVDYMMWRKITERESMHLGRMTSNECLKGYISTARAIDVAIYFGTAKLTKSGWVYVTVVHDGFVVPRGLTEVWGTEESEIAQWGPIPQDRIVGFRRITSAGECTGPVYMRSYFRITDPAAFREVFAVLSGKKP
jgi:hypothetical protein